MATKHNHPVNHEHGARMPVVAGCPACAEMKREYDRQVATWPTEICAFLSACKLDTLPASKCGAEGEATGEEMANARLIAAAPNLLGFVQTIAEMMTEEEFGEEPPASEDWIMTVNDLIEHARRLRKQAEG